MSASARSIDLDGENLTSQFTYYLYYLLGKSPKRTVVEEYEDIIKGKALLDAYEVKETESPISFIKNFKNFFEAYNEIDDSGDPVIVSFYYLPWKTFWATCLLTAKHRNYREFDSFAKILRRFLYISYICGYSLNQLKKPLLDMINAVKTETAQIDDIRKICEDFLIEKDYLNRMKTNLSQRSVFGEAWLKPVLLLLNSCFTDAETVVKVPIDSRLHVEHILPRKFNTAEWSHVDADDAESYKNTLGNLTLLGYKKNLKAQNDSFEIKLKIYNGEDGSGRWTCYDITKNIKDIAHDAKWDIDSIKHRNEFLLKKLEEVLEISGLTT